MGLFYTGKGDGGVSDIGSLRGDENPELPKKKILVKDSIISEALGNLDELNSLIGLVKHQTISSDFVVVLEGVQETLFIIQANVADALFRNPEKLGVMGDNVPKFPREKIEAMESKINEIEIEVSPEKSFVIPGATLSASWLDFTRTVCRRTERSVVSFSKKYEIPAEILSYTNRLSSLFFAMARAEVKRAGVSEKFPRYDRPNI